MPGLYIRQGYEIGAFVVGSENPMTVLTSGSVTKLTTEELTFVIGHEVGHIKSQHIVYQLLAEEVLPLLGGLLNAGHTWPGRSTLDADPVCSLQLVSQVGTDVRSCRAVGHAELGCRRHGHDEDGRGARVPL